MQTKDLFANIDVRLKTFYDLYYTRRSVRQFQDKPIEDTVLDRLIETLRRAPSAENRQPWHFYIIKDKLRPQFNEVFYKEGFYQAPVIIAACAVPGKAWVRAEDKINFAWVDVTIALTDMINAAAAEGIGSCWIASFNVNRAEELLNLPDNVELVSLMALGYPDKPLCVEEKNRKTLNEIVTIR